MFTGIVEELGTVQSLEKKMNLDVLAVKAGKASDGTKPGDSIAVNGVCLTVAAINGDMLTFDLMKETIEKTSLSALKPGVPVNLERALRADSRLGGHFVTGHADDTVKVLKRITLENYVELQFEIKDNLRRYVVPKGSISIEGVSLTVGAVAGDYFSVYLIPFTLEATTLGSKNEGDLVNVEIDILARYVLDNKERT